MVGSRNQESQISCHGTISKDGTNWKTNISWAPRRTLHGNHFVPYVSAIHADCPFLGITEYKSWKEERVGCDHLVSVLVIVQICEEAIDRVDIWEVQGQLRAVMNGFEQYFRTFEVEKGTGASTNLLKQLWWSYSRYKDEFRYSYREQPPTLRDSKRNGRG